MLVVVATNGERDALLRRCATSRSRVGPYAALRAGGPTLPRPVPGSAPHSQELSDDVCDAHIALYVNAFTHDLGEDGYAAAAALLARAATAGLLPPVAAELLR